MKLSKRKDSSTFKREKPLANEERIYSHCALPERVSRAGRVAHSGRERRESTGLCKFFLALIADVAARASRGAARAGSSATTAQLSRRRAPVGAAQPGFTLTIIFRKPAARWQAAFHPLLGKAFQIASLQELDQFLSDLDLRSHAFDEADALTRARNSMVRSEALVTCRPLTL